MTRFSIIIPTHQRRDVVVRNVRSLAAQVSRDFEVIVVDDGSSDGTAMALRSLQLSFALTVVEQANSGAAAARNAGAAIATGEVLLFLDDDMEADPQMLVEHDRSHAQGAEVVLGDLPLHPSSPRNLLSWGVDLWSGTRRRRLTAAGAQIEIGDMLTGQLSISRVNYDSVGGFDPSFTRGGWFGGEDADFGYRARRSGLKIVFNAAAVSYQYYDVDPAEYLKRARQEGRSSHELQLKHLDPAQRLGVVPGFRRRRDRWLLGPLVLAAPSLSWPLRAAVVSLARTGHTGSRLRELFFLVRTMERLRGARAAKRADATRQAVVFAYHALADHGADPVLRPYSVPPARFAEQLDSLASRGWTFVDASTILGALIGDCELPQRAALITFDDGYTDFARAAMPLLTERRIPAVVFVVAGRIGTSNQWDQEIGASTLELMDAEALRGIVAEGVEIGSHGMSHRSLADLDLASVASEVRESASVLERLGLPRPRLIAYPYGESTPAAAEAVRSAGYRAAFTVSPGVLAPGLDPYALPRVQVLAKDTSTILRLKLATTRWPPALRKRLLALFGTEG